MIILYGGSFNPPTIAHYKISEYLITKYKPKHFIFVPVGNYYQKEELIDFKYRYEMVKILSEKLTNAYVSDYENQPSYKGTITTLDHFQNIYKDEDLHYVIGADNLPSLSTWIEFVRLISTYKFIVLNRNNINLKEIIRHDEILKNYQKAFIIEEDFPKISVSASDYRNNFDDTVVLPEINSYIYKNNLYSR